MNASDILWPTAHEIARAIVAAARAEGEDALAIANGKTLSRARVYAFAILMHRFPTMPGEQLIVKLGVDRMKALDAYAIAIHISRGGSGKNDKWFNLAALNTISEAIGWPSMTAEEAQVRRMNSNKNPATIKRWSQNAAALVAATESPDPDIAPAAPRPITLPKPVYPGSYTAPDDRPVISYKPEAPTHERNLTAEICGDPQFERSALHQRITEEKSKGARDYVHPGR